MAPDIPQALTVGAGTLVIGGLGVLAQVDPLGDPSSYLEYGFAGLVGVSFILMIWAVVNNKIVSQDTNQLIAEGAKREQTMLRLIEEGQKQGQQLLSQNDRLLDMLGQGKSP